MGKQEKEVEIVYQLRLSFLARQNIAEITGYIAFINDQPLNAEKVGDAIVATLKKIAANPFAFKECAQLPTKTKMYRQAICLSWYIIYRIKTNEIVVLGIIHKARKPSRLKTLRKII